VVLLEKAWAKLKKSYSNISTGNAHEVLKIFSVAPVKYHHILDYREEEINSHLVN
jgi:hypothetical protein